MAARAPVQSPSPPSPRAQLRVLNGPLEGRVVELKERLTPIRRAGSPVVTILEESGRWVATRITGTDPGVRLAVNGRVLGGLHPLHDGDVLEVGGVRFTFVAPQTADRQPGEAGSPPPSPVSPSGEPAATRTATQPGTRIGVALRAALVNTQRRVKAIVGRTLEWSSAVLSATTRSLTSMLTRLRVLVDDGLRRARAVVQRGVGEPSSRGRLAMTLWLNVAVALRALRGNSLRSALTMLGVIIGVAAVVAMVAVGSGAHQQISDQIRSLGTNLLYVQPHSQDSGGTRLSGGKRFTLTVEDAEAIEREVPVVQGATPVSSGELKAVYGNRNWSTTFVGAYPFYFTAREWPLAAGRLFTAEDVEGAAKVAVLGSLVADKLFGTVSPLGQVVRVRNVPFTVIGVLEAKGQSVSGTDQDDVIVVPFSAAMQRVLGGLGGATRSAVGLILAKVVRADAMEEAQTEIRALLRQRHELVRAAPDDFSIRNMEALMRKKEATSRTLIVQLAALASVSLIVGGISIMNIMLVSVTERTREIGLRIAVGARQRDIRNQFLIEALTLCLLGGVAGILAGIAVAVGIAQVADWPIVIHPGSALLAFTFAGAVGVFFGFYPARKASRLDPIEALRYE